MERTEVVPQAVREGSGERAILAALNALQGAVDDLADRGQLSSGAYFTLCSHNKRVYNATAWLTEARVQQVQAVSSLVSQLAARSLVAERRARRATARLAKAMAALVATQHELVRATAEIAEARKQCVQHGVVCGELCV